MDYGEVFTGSFRAMWRHKKLWGFGMLGYLLIALATAIYTPFVYNFMSGWMETISQLAQSAQPDEAVGAVMTSMLGLWVGLSLLMIGYLISYLVNLVMRGATINEAMHAWSEDRTRTRRGLSAGTGRAVHVFALDLLWGIPPVVIGAGSYVLAFASLILASAGGGSNDAEIGALLAFCGLLCCGLCLALFLVLLGSIFAPLMYQSAVQGRRGLLEAIREGWRLAGANLGPMIVFALLLFGVWTVLYLLLQAISLPLSLPFMRPWMDAMNQMTEDVQRGVVPTWSMPPLNPATLAITGLASGLATLLVYSFMQSLSLTLYAEVYRRLTGEQQIAGGFTPAPIGPTGPAIPTLPPAPEPPDAMPAPGAQAPSSATPVWRPQDTPGPLVPDEDETPKDESAPYV